MTGAVNAELPKLVIFLLRTEWVWRRVKTYRKKQSRRHGKGILMHTHCKMIALSSVLAIFGNCDLFASDAGVEITIVTLKSGEKLECSHVGTVEMNGIKVYTLNFTNGKKRQFTDDDVKSVEKKAADVAEVSEETRRALVKEKIANENAAQEKREEEEKQQDQSRHALSLADERKHAYDHAESLRRAGEELGRQYDAFSHNLSVYQDNLNRANVVIATNQAQYDADKTQLAGNSNAGWGGSNLSRSLNADMARLGALIGQATNDAAIAQQNIQATQKSLDLLTPPLQQAKAQFEAAWAEYQRLKN